MDDSKRRLAVTAAVYLGALLLFGPLTVFLLQRTVEIVAGAIGVGVPTGVVAVFFLIGAIAITYEVVGEVAAVQLHGTAALRRGSPRRRFVRNLPLLITAIAAGIVVLEIGLSAFQQGVAHGQVPLVGISLVVFASLVWALVRSIRSFYRQFHSAE
jgi:hypothetical protein